MPLPHTVLVAAYCAVILLLSSDPSPPQPLAFANADKLLHGVAFGGLAFLVALGMKASDLLYSPRARCWIPVLVAGAYGFLVELYQGILPSRQFDWLDLGADVLGAVLLQCGLAVCWWRFMPWQGLPAYRLP